MFFKLKIHEKTGEKLHFPASCTVDFTDREYADCLRTFFAEDLFASPRTGIPCRRIVFRRGFPAAVKQKIREAGTLSSSPEAYAIVLGQTTKIYAADERGFIYAAAMLCMLAECGEAECGFVYDYPLAGTRGYRVYLPSRAGFDAFFKMIDFLARYKYNSIILEIGGAMEYKRHPEINERWAEFCREVHAYSGRAHEIQKKMYPWGKNSIHCDNAEGDILTQDECRTLAAYCRSRGLEVIPECPTLSHCDYIVMAHPEIREQEGDAYPDTYCPNHPDSYKYAFDVLDEVISVFAPSMINIGHDELYSVGVCPRCKNTSAPQLYANDIHKIRDYLAGRGVKTMMWGEKLLNARKIPGPGKPIGGAGHGKGLSRVPALYPCRDLLPKDVTFLHWYWPFNPDYDRVFLDRGYKVLYGNLSALNLRDWDKRRAAGIDGGFVSNWGSFGEEYMQRNMQYLTLIGSAFVFWNGQGDASGEEARLMYTMREAYRLKCAKIKNPLRITHTTPHSIPYACFYDGVFIEDEKYLLGHYVLRFADGTEATLPVKYGTNIACAHFGDYLHDSGLREVSYSTMPQRYRSGFAYECVYEHPNPGAALCSVTYRPAPGKEDIAVELIALSIPDPDRGAAAHIARSSAADAEFAWDG